MADAPIFAPDTPVSTKVFRSRNESGQLIRVLALTPSGRIVGEIDLRVPLEPGRELESRVGVEGQQRILSLVEELARLVGNAVENPTHAEP